MAEERITVMSALFPLGQMSPRLGASCVGESETAAHLFLGPSCNWRLGELEPTDVAEK